MNHKRAIRWMVVCLSLFLIGGVEAQPWPWPASASGDVHEIFQNYGKYQDFFSIPLIVSPYNPNPYCHDALDIAIDDGEGIYSVIPIGAADVIRVLRPPESVNRCRRDRDYWKALAFPTTVDYSDWDGGWVARRYFTLSHTSGNHEFFFTHYEPWSVNKTLAKARYFGMPFTSPTHTKLAEVVDWFSWFGKDHLHYMIYDKANDLQLNPVKCLDPDPALLSGCGIEYDEDSDKRFTFRYAEDEDEDDAMYFEKIEVPEGGQIYLYHVLWGNVDVITRCWDQFQETGDGWKLTPYEIGLKLGRYNYSTSTFDVLVDYSPLVVFDGWVSDATGRRAIWSYDVNNSEAYTHVIYENDNTNDSAGGFGIGEELSFVLTNQDGVLDPNGRPVIELSDADYYWDTNGKVGDDWNDDDETQAHEATSQSDALFPDRKYYIGSMPKDHQGRDAFLWKKVILDNFAPYVGSLKARLERGTTREEIVFYEAEWDGTLNVITREPCRPIPGDVIKIDVFFSEAMRDEGIEVKVIREGASGGLAEYPLVQESLESEEFENDHWTGRIAPTTWGSLRNMLEGKLYVSVEAYDKAGNGLDSDPSTVARRIDRDGNWEDYEDADGNPTTTGDVDRWNHWFFMESYGELLAFLDVSASVANASHGWSPEAYHVVDRVLELMQEAHEGTVEDQWRGSVFRYWGYPLENDGGIQMLSDFGQGLEASRTALQGLWQGSIGNACSFQSSLDSVTTFMKDVSNRCRPRCILAVGDGEINRGDAIADQEEIWMRAACDTTYQTSTPIFAVMPIERANMSDAMCRAVVRSGGKYFAIPGSMMYMDTPLAQIIFDLMDNYADIYAADVEEVTARAEHWFRIDELVGNLILVGAWAQYGLNLGQNEIFCGGGPTGCLDYEDGTDSLNAEMSTESKEEFLARMNEKREWPEYEGNGEVRGGPRTSMTLYDADNVVVPATGTIGPDVVYWRLSPTSADTGLWHVTVDGAAENYQFEVAGKGGVWVELAGQRLLAESTAADILVRIVGTDSVSNPSWELLDENGQAVGGLSLTDDGSHGDGRAGDGLFGGSWAGVSEDGLYRVRLKGEVGGARIERVTREGIWVVASPEFEFVTPGGSGPDTASGNYVISWSDSSEFAARIALYYDEDQVWGGQTLIKEDIREDDEEDEYVWNTWIDGEPGTFYLVGVISDDVNPDNIVYSSSTVSIGEEGYLDGWPVHVGGQVEAPLVAYDLGEDGTTEILVGAKDSLLYCFSSDGTSYHVNYPFYCHGKVMGSVAVGDATGDSASEIAVCCSDSGLVWLLSAQGVVESGWPIAISEGASGGATMADIVGDSALEVILGSQNDSLYVFTGSGERAPGWPRSLAGSISNASAATADANHDNEREIYFPSTLSMHCFEADGSEKWSYDPSASGQIWSSPCLGDVTGDGELEVAFTTYWYTDNSSRLYLLDANTGAEAPGWAGGKSIGRNARSSVAIGYLDGAGGSGGLRAVVATGDGEIRAFTGSGVQLFNKQVSDYGIWSSPVISDIDGDQDMEIAAGCDHRVYVLAAATGDTISDYCRAVGSNIISTIAIADLDGDGSLELVAAEKDSVIHVWDLPGTISADLQEWPQFQRDAARTGVYAEQVSPATPEVVSLEVVDPDSLKLRWKTVDRDVYGREEVVTKYLIYRGDEPYETDWSALAGEVEAPDTMFTEQSTAVGDPDNNVFYRVKAVDMHENLSILSDETMGEIDFNAGGRGRGGDEERRREAHRR